MLPTKLDSETDYLPKDFSKFDVETVKQLSKIISISSNFVAAKNIARVSAADPTNVQEVYAAELGIMNDYYNTVLTQSKHSFRAALGAAFVGTLFFLAAVVIVLLNQHIEIAAISLIAGAIVQVIAGINFYLYGQTTKQLASFHSRLDRFQRYLLANSVCEGLNDPEKQQARVKVVERIIAATSKDNNES